MVKLIDKYETSQKAFSAAHGLSKSKLHYWIKKLAKSQKALPSTTEPAFVPLAIIPSPIEKPDKFDTFNKWSGNRNTFIDVRSKLFP